MAQADSKCCNTSEKVELGLLDQVIRLSSVFISARHIARKMELTVKKGLVFVGKPNLADRIDGYLARNVQNEVMYMYRKLPTLSPANLEELFERASAGASALLLLEGLECSSAEQADVIIKRVNGIAANATPTILLATTSDLSLVDARLRNIFSAEILQESVELPDGV